MADNSSAVSEDIKNNSDQSGTQDGVDSDLTKKNTDMPKISKKIGKVVSCDVSKLKINSISESTITKDTLTLTKYNYNS
jgi:hypothetical protein